MDVISDLHLQAHDPATAAAWRGYLDRGGFDALIILGDLFEVWVGDDVLDRASDTPEHRFWHACVAALRAAARHAPVYVMRGNRDFLLGAGFARHAQVTLLDDPCVLAFGPQRWLLTHGDAWCLADTDYQAFRQTVRSPEWQTAFLQRPLAEREAIARQLRDASQTRQSMQQAAHLPWADVDDATAMHWIETTGAQHLIHGHTHRPAAHDLGQGHWRLVLSDWDASAQPPRAQRLSLDAGGGWHRHAEVA